MILDVLVRSLSSVPPPVATIILATLPIAELRGALPVAVLVYGIPLLPAVLLSILGNMLPVYFLLLFFERAAQWLRQHSPLADRFLTYLFERTRRKLHDKVERYGVWALTLFVAVPLPVTGAWTGTLAAFVFGIPRRQAFFAIVVGLCIASAIVSIVTLGTSFTVSALLG